MTLQEVLLTADGFGLPSYVYTRSSSGYQIDADGVLRLKSTDQLRLDYLDLDNDGVRQTPSIVVEMPSTNRFTQSIAFSHSTWGKAAVTVEANVGAAPDLSTQADLVVPSTVVAEHYVSQALTAAASTDHAMSVYASPAGYSFLTLQIQNSSNNGSAGAVFALSSSGSVVDTFGSGVGTYRRSSIDRIRPGVYRCSVTGTLSTSTGILGLCTVLQTSSQRGVSWAGGGSSAGLGVLLWGAQFEEAMPAETSFIATSAAALSRGADVLYLAFPYRPAPMVLYQKLIWKAAPATNPIILRISDAAGTGPYLHVYSNGSAVVVAHQNTAANPGVSTLVSTATITFGDVVEVLAVLYANGSVNVSISVNGGTVVAGAVSDAHSLVAAWSAERIYVGSGAGRVIDVKVAAGDNQSMQSMAYMRSLAPFWVIDGVAIPVAVDSVRVDRLEIGDRDRSFDGTLRETIRSRVSIWRGETQPVTVVDRNRILEALENSTQPQATLGAMCRTSTGKLPAVHTRVDGESLIQSSTDRRYVLSWVAEQSS